MPKFRNKINRLMNCIRGTYQESNKVFCMFPGPFINTRKM